MKKSIIIFLATIITLSLTAFGFIDWNDSEAGQLGASAGESIATDALVVANTTMSTYSGFIYDLRVEDKAKKEAYSDFIYDVGTRFGPIKKEELDRARSINDFFDKEHIQTIVSLKSVSIIVIEGDKQTEVRETGYSDILTDGQLKLLQSAGYSTNISIRVEYLEKNYATGQLEENYASPYLTIVPETQAQYVSGRAALIEYLKENSKEVRAHAQTDKLQPAKLYFTVTKNGTIGNVHLDRTSNYPEIDNKMIELITNAPKAWKPAKNSKGEKVDQELVVSFGLMGC